MLVEPGFASVCEALLELCKAVGALRQIGDGADARRCVDVGLDVVDLRCEGARLGGPGERPGGILGRHEQVRDRGVRHRELMTRSQRLEQLDGPVSGVEGLGRPADEAEHA